MHLRFTAVLLLAFTAQAQHVAHHKASVVDVPARIATLQTTQDSLLRTAIKQLHSCAALPVVTAPTGRMEIPHHYLNGSHGPTNPEEGKATVVYGKFEQRITAGMNQYLATGNDAEAKCALDQLDAWAAANTLTNYDPRDSANTQSWYQAEWTLCSVGVTLSVLVNDDKLPLDELKRVAQWANAATHRLLSFEKPGELGNNHHYWRALAAASVGIVSSDDSLFQYSVTVYKQAMDQLDKNAAFPLEMARHERAAHYQSFALQPLVVIAELATRQGVDLYTYSVNGHTLRDAIVFLGKAIDDPSIVKQYTPEEQVGGFGGSDYAPFTFFAARFGTDGLGKSIPEGLSKPTFETRIGGSTTLLAGK